MNRQGTAVVDEYPEELRTGTSNPAGVRVVVQGRLLEHVAHSPIKIRGEILLIHEQRYCRSSIQVSEETAVNTLRAATSTQIESFP